MVEGVQVFDDVVLLHSDDVTVGSMVMFHTDGVQEYSLDD
jgi:hypothetical protein